VCLMVSSSCLRSYSVARARKARKGVEEVDGR